jgi:hypothetical protein
MVILLSVMLSTNARSQDTDRPPGVSEANWIPISETAGVVITEDRAVGDSAYLNRQLGFPAQRRTGILVVRHNGTWIAFEALGDTSPRVLPLR